MPPRGASRNVWSYFHHNVTRGWVGDAAGVGWVEARDAGKHPARHRTGLTAKNSPARNVSRARLRNPILKQEWAWPALSPRNLSFSAEPLRCLSLLHLARALTPEDQVVRDSKCVCSSEAGNLIAICNPSIYQISV